MVKKRQNDPQDDDSTAESCDEKQTYNVLFNMSPICPHIKTGIDMTGLRKALKKENVKKENCSECLKMLTTTTAETELEIPLNDTTNNTSSSFPDDGFEYDKTLWLCLKCGSQLCGRSKRGHALKHFEV